MKREQCKVVLQLPGEAAEKILAGYKAKDPALMAILKEFKILAVCKTTKPKKRLELLCRTCFCREMDFRRERNKQLSEDCRFKLPSWDSLKVYRGAQ